MCHTGKNYRYELDGESLKLAIDNKREDIARFLLETCDARGDTNIQVRVGSWNILRKIVTPE